MDKHSVHPVKSDRKLKENQTRRNCWQSKNFICMNPSCFGQIKYKRQIGKWNEKCNVEIFLFSFYTVFNNCNHFFFSLPLKARYTRRPTSTNSGSTGLGIGTKKRVSICFVFVFFFLFFLNNHFSYYCTDLTNFMIHCLKWIKWNCNFPLDKSFSK